MNMVVLDTTDLALASALVLLNAALSLALRLRLERQLLVATLRMVVQMSLVGLVLEALLTSASALWTALAATAMVLLAGREIVARQERRMTGVWSYGLGTGCMFFASVLVTIFALTTQIRSQPWFDPRYAIPLLGIVLGNTMTGISLGLQTLTSRLSRDRGAVEAQLTLGATRWQATLPVTRGALRNALMPTVNSMAITGLVAFPGTMTGQILAGAEPVEAVKYQVLIMFLIAGGTALGAVAAVLGGVFRLTDTRHRLRLERLAEPRNT